MKNIFLTLTLLLFCSGISISQMTDKELTNFVRTASKKSLVHKNTELLMDGYYEQSIVVVDQLLKMDPDSRNFHYRKGLALFNTNLTDYQDVLPYFLKATEKKTKKNFDFLSKNMKAAPHDSYYYLGRVYHLTHQIPQAKANYNAYLKLKPRDKDLKESTHFMLIQCGHAEEFLKSPSDYKITNLSDQINSKFPEYSPVISRDGKNLYFTSRRLWDNRRNKKFLEPGTHMYLEDVYRSTRIEGENWEKAELLEFSTADKNEASVAISHDERTVYIYKDDTGNGDLYIANYENGKFGELEPLDIQGINSEDWEPHITASPDGQHLYFSSDRDGGFGGRDLYRVTKLPNGEWSEPQNLGPNINSKYDEDAPFISVDNKTLYFSSNSDKSMGGFDIFVTFLDEDSQTWSEPVNLGYPLNTSGDDIFFTTIADGTIGYFSSFRAGGHGEKDIYRVESNSLKVKDAKLLLGQVISSTGEAIPDNIKVYINCLNCTKNQVVNQEIELRPEDAHFFASLSTCREYELIVKNENEEFQRETFNTSCEKIYQEIQKTIVINMDEPIVNATMSGKVISRSGSELPEDLKFSLVCLDCDEDTNPKEIGFNKDSGNYSTIVEPCHEYLASFERDGKLFYKENFRTDCDSTDLKKDFILDLDFGKDDFLPFALKHYFGYNNNEISPSNSNLLELFNLMDQQVNKGRKEFTLIVDASASKVTTYSFKNNMELAKTRANNIVKMLNSHIDSKPELKGKVKINIRDVGVDGPEYTPGDQQNIEKYIPYQFVVITLEGTKKGTAVDMRQSKDAELK